MPFIVITFKKSRNAGLILGWFLIIIGSVIVGYVAYHIGFTAGIYTIENFLLYSRYMIKPYCKLQVYGLGILGAIMYLDILEYRKHDPLRKKTLFPKLHFLHNNIVIAKICMLLGVTLIFLNMFVTYQPGMDAYKWSTF